MTKSASNGGGQFKSPSDFQGQKIEFPVTYHLKAVLPAANTNNETRLEEILNNNQIVFSFQNKKMSSKGTYASYTYEVTMENKIQMTQLYDDLKKIEGLKFAI